MLNKKLFMFVALAVCTILPAVADDVVFDEGAVAVMEYQVDGSLFQRIADLEQEKVLMQLEKERAQLQLDLERLAAEQRKLTIETEAMDTRAEEQKNKLEADRQKLAAEREKLEQQRQKLEQQPFDTGTPAAAAKPAPEPARASPISERYRLLNVMGVGRQLQATVEDLNTGQRRTVWAGKTMDGYTVKSISLDDGIVFTKDGEIETLGVGK